MADGDSDGDCFGGATGGDRPSASELVDADAVVDSLALPAFMLDSEHTLVAYNAGFAGLLGIDPCEALGKDYRDILSYAVYPEGERELSLANKIVEAPTDAEVVYGVERVDWRPQYSGPYVYEDTSTMTNARGEEIPIGFIATPIFEDDELVAVLELVEERNQGLENFPGLAGVLSHDLRNPLSVLKTNLSIKREDMAENRYETMMRSIERMEKIIDDVLTLSKRSDPELELETLQVEQLAQQAWHSIDSGAASLEVSPVSAEADESRLTNVFENLLRNAIEHGGEAVTVRVGPLEDGKGFYLEDNGPGIPAEERDSVFKHGHTTSEGGTGYGLSIVHKTVQNHGWTIDVMDESGGGARFEIRY